LQKTSDIVLPTGLNHIFF